MWSASESGTEDEGIVDPRSDCMLYLYSADGSNSPTLSGAQASSTQSNSSKPDLRHYEMYRSSSIVRQWTDRERTSLKTEEDCRMAMVWIALLGGGDYAPEGLTGFGEFHLHCEIKADDQVPPLHMPSQMREWRTFCIAIKLVDPSTKPTWRRSTPS